MVNSGFEYSPNQIVVSLECGNGLIEQVREELESKAQTDSSQCYGYFPSLSGRNDIDVDLALPACEAFAKEIPELTVEGKAMSFNFLRLSLIEQKAESPFHLDSDAETALTGDATTIGKRIVWRLLVNMSAENPRKISYIDANPMTLPLESHDGYINCPSELINTQDIRYIDLKPRIRRIAQGALFCSSRLLHTGQDDENGHFIAAFGFEE